MDSDITESLRTIITSDLNDETAAQKSFRIIVQFNKYLEEEEISPISLDNYLLFIFNKEYGLMRFINNVLFKSEFKNTKVKCLELFYILVNNFSLKMEIHFVEINELCISILKFTQGSSDEKVKALVLICLLLEKFNVNMEYTNEYLNLYKTLLLYIDGKSGDSVSKKIYECLGLYVKQLQYTLKDYEIINLQTIFVSKILTDIRAKKKLIGGLFLGLRHIQNNDSLICIKDEKLIKDLYFAMKKIIEEACENKIKIPARAALSFLQHNITLFSDHLFKEHQFWHDTLGKWISELGVEEKKLASRVLPLLYKCFSQHLVGEKKDVNKKILKMYLISFRKMLDKQTSTSLERQICIHGIRIFFESAPMLLGNQEVKNFSIKLLHAFRMAYLVEQDFTSDRWLLLPDYVQMVASVIVSKGIETEEILLLKQSLIVLIKHYADFPILNRSKVNKAFLVVLHTIGRFDFLELFLGDLIYQCVIWSCSHQHISEMNEDSTETVTVLSYLPFWKEILNAEIKNYEEQCETDLKEKQTFMVMLIVKKLVDTLFLCVNKLDITIKFKEECCTTKMKQAIELNKKDDFAIFLNIVDFYEQILTFINSQILDKYICKLLNFCMKQSLRFPLISGFYRLLAVCLKVAKKLNIFNNSEGILDGISTYMRHLVSVVNQYEDELLISALKVLLECPVNVIEGMLPACIPVFITIFSIGRQYLPIADLCINTLSTWQSTLKHDDIKDLIGKIVFKLDAILRSKSLAYLAPEFQKSIKTTRALRKRKVAIEIEPELVKLQRKVVRFLGKQTSSVCEKMLDGERIVSEVWSDTEHLKLTLPFPDSKFDMRLDRMIPLVVELALYNSDRKTRVTACELLQALVVFFLGITKQMTSKGQMELLGVLKKFSSAILELGCDPDEVIRDLFEPLVLQIIHWYSSPVQSGKCHTAVILEALFEGVSNSTNANLRNFCGKCIGEYVKWTIKQSGERYLQQKNLNIKTLIKKMRYLSTHPNNFKKLGAAIMFNNSYVFLREDRSLLNIFWIEIFEIFLSSLHFIEDNEDNRPVVSQIHAALNHLQRGFTEKSTLFKRDDEKRRKPHGFTGTTSGDILDFLVENVRTKNFLCRDKSAELFSCLYPYLSNNLYSHDFMMNPLKWLQSSGDGNHSEITNVKEIMIWSSDLLRELDKLIFLMKNAKLNDENLKKVTTIQSLSHYLEFLATNHFEELGNDEVISIMDKLIFSIEKNRINNKILIFLKSISDHNIFIETLWNRNLWCFLVFLLFNLGDEETSTKKDIQSFLQCINDKLENKKLEEMKEYFENYIKSNFSDDLMLNSPISSKQKNLIHGMNILCICGYNNIPKLYPQIVQKFVMKCLETSSRNGSIYLNEVEINYYSSVMKLSLENEFEEFVKFLFIPDKVEELEAQGKITLGSFLLNNFKTVIIPIILKNFEQFLELSTCRSEFISVCFSYVKSILLYISRFQQELSWADTILDSLSRKWNNLNDFFNEKLSNLLEGLELMNILNSVKKSVFLTSSLISSILENKEFTSLRSNFETKLEILVFIFKHLDLSIEEENDLKLRTALDQIHITVSQANNENDRTLCLMKISVLYQILKESQSVLLFEFIMKLYMTFPDFEEHMENIRVIDKYITKLSDAQQIKVMNLLINVMKNPSNSNRKLGNDILNMVFQKTSSEAFYNYFLDNIKCILEELQKPLSKDNIVVKSVYFILVGILFARVPIGKDNEANLKMQQAAIAGNTPDHKELLRCFLKCTLNSFREEISLDSKNEEALRICRCHCYNTLVSIAVNGLNDPNFHVKLFTRMDDGKDILWRSIVDTKKLYKFEKDFTSLPQKKKILVNIKQTFEAQLIGDNSTRLLRSQRIFNSSLGVDITMHDFNNVIPRTQSFTENQNKTMEIEMDYTQVNDHECMATICALIKYLVETNIIDPDLEISELPPCFIGLRNVLMTETTPVNVKIFLVKVIENTSHIFNHYSKWFLSPVMKFIADKCAGDEMNFFITDLVVMLANWSEKLHSQHDIDQDLATKVIKFLFDNLSSSRRDIFRYNLELIGILLEAWKSNLLITGTFIMSVLASAKIEETDKEIQFFSLLLHNDLFVFETNIITEFLEFVNNRLNSNKKAIYMPCSEMLGIFLKKWREQNAFASYDDIGVDTMINNFWQNDKDKGGYILEGVTIYHPEFLQEKHVIRLLSRLGCVIYNSQYVFLKVMSRATFSFDCINEFLTEKWENYINSQSSEVQVITLSLMKKNMNILEKEPILPDIISAICQKKTSSNELCKNLALEIAMEICSEHFKDPSRFSNIKDLCQEVLIDSLADENQAVSQTIRNFWINSDILSTNLIKRFVQCFSLIYKPKIEDTVMENGINLLFSLLKSNPDYDQLLFEHPLEDCKFEDYELSVNPVTQNPYEIPMFAETFLSNTPARSENPFKFGELHATQTDFTFSATVSTNQDALSQILCSQSSLFLDSFSNSFKGFKDPNEYIKGRISKRRFLKSKAKISEYHANVEVKSQIQKSQKRIRKAKERDKQVCITRKYRKGDFPDIQIYLSAIIEPLMVLASDNSDVAKIFYVNLFESIKDQMGEDDWLELTDAISKIFGTSLDFNINLFRTLMDFVLVSKNKIKIDPSLMTECCHSSSLVSTGTLILEDCLMNLDTEPQPKRIRAMESSGEGVYWIKLAELYKELNDWDVVCSIFENKVPCDDLVKTAISVESKKLWPQARDLYRDVIEKDLTEDKKDFYYEAYFRCLANMGQWQKISENIKSTEEESYWNMLWDDDWKRKKLLPWYITSEVNNILHKEELSPSFLSNINTSLCESRKAEHLKLNFSEDIATMWMLNEDVDTAEMYLRSSIDSFLSQWQILDPIFHGIRLKKLLKLRHCTTIYEFIDIYRMFGSIEAEKIFGYLELLWSNTHWAVSYSTMLQEIYILHYKQFLSLVRSKMLALDEQEYDGYSKNIKNWKLKLDLGLVDAALKESNFHLAKKYLEKHRKEKGIDLHMAKMMFSKCSLLQEPLQISTTMVKSLKILKDFSVKDISKETALKIHLTSFEILQQLSSLLSKKEEIRDQLSGEIRQILGEDARGILEDYGATKIYQFLEEYFATGSKGIENTDVASSYLQVSYYLIEKESVDVNILSKMILRSMKLGDAEARQLFPVLLQQENLGSLYKDVFKQESDSVPTWMFLSWIPQLLANMNSENIFAINSILIRLSETYPQAIMYPYRLSREQFDMENNYLSEIVEKMDALLLSEDSSKFLRALGNVCVPEMKLLYHVEKIRKNAGEVKEIENIRNFILSEFYSDPTDSGDVHSFQGNTFKRIRSFKKHFTDFKGDKFIKEMETLRNNLRETKKSNSLLLKDYSPWLANFSSIKLDMDLEIPGQYDGKKMPLPQYHVKIYKFHPDVSVMSSIRKPIKLTVLGNDTKEYSYLVKFGEDIRQDQRIEQLFDVMNDIFHKNHGYSQKISLETFEVIPLTTSLGLIKWIDGTIVIDGFMRRCMKNKGKTMDSAQDKFLQFIFSSKRSAKNYKDAYGESAKIHDRIKIISNYQRAVNEVERNVLRKAFWNLSTSTESFVALRHNFMRSYAVMCIAHWILGIGDRHLSNMLVDLSNGHVIGIDFGCAFGTATQMLEVPELIPFRLTPQFIDIMEPLGVMGHFRASMINTMKCLKKNQKLLVATMSVFIKEPSLNWLEVPSSEQSTTSTNWFPNRKIDQVKRKLNGINPKEIFKEDLEDGRVKEYLKPYCDLVDGVPEQDYRSRVAREGLSVEEQVDCLIDQARDLNLLGRTFVGWKPWV